MWTRAASVLVVVAVVSGIGGVGEPQTLLQRAREHDPLNGPLNITVSGLVPARSVEELLNEADLVVQGLVMGHRVELDKDQTLVHSIHRVQIIRELFQRSSPPGSPTEATGGTIEVERLGGTIQLEGRTLIISDGTLREFRPNEQFVLFLKRSPRPMELHRYSVLYSNFGCFDVVDGHLAAIGSAKAKHEELDGADIDSLLTRIQTRLSTAR